MLGETFNIDRLAGEVTVASAPGQPQLAGRVRTAQKGRTFVPLEEPRQLTMGSFVNTQEGAVSISTAVDFTTTTQLGNFSNGLFQVLQARRANAPAVMRLKGSSFSRRCRAGASGGLAQAAQRRRLSSRTVRQLRSNANGNFRTRGRRSAATVRGTLWITADRCDGTLTRVRRGRVSVRDFRRRRNVIVPAGKQYLAKAPG